MSVNLVSCKYDDGELWENFNQLEERVAILETLCKHNNENISSLEVIVGALNSGDYITGIISLTNDGQEIGYRITFAKASPITIYNGKNGQNGQNGKDGHTPIIGVKQDTDGVYYWTLDGDFIEIDGHKMKVQGKDGQNGEDGKDGVTPQFKIEKGYWYISYNGINWDKAGKATGANGTNSDCIFSSVTQDDENVYFTLNDGNIITIKKTNQKGNENEEHEEGVNTFPNYSSYVTIIGDDVLGYTFYSDLGYILRPTSASVQEVLPGLGNSNVKRAYIAFNLMSSTENGKDLQVGETYDIVLLSSYYANYAIPTYGTIRYTAASDSLITNNMQVLDVNKDIWAINGYLNALVTINYQQNKNFSMNTYYSEEDVDVANNTLNLNLYYNSNSESPNAQGQSVFSFRLPEEVIYTNQFSTDSINLVLNAITGFDGSQLTKVGECKVALKDFSEPKD